MGGYHVMMQFDIEADRAAVLAALRTQDGIRSWWSTRSTLTMAGATKSLQVEFPDAPLPFEFSVQEPDETRTEWVTGAFPPPWAGTTLRWDVTENPDRDGLRLRFEQRDFDADNPVIAVVTPVWAQIALRLKAYAETGRPQPFFDF